MNISLGTAIALIKIIITINNNNNRNNMTLNNYNSKKNSTNFIAVWVTAIKGRKEGRKCFI